MKLSKFTHPAALLGHTAVVEIPAGRRYHGLRFGSGPVISLEEAARQIHPRKIMVGGREIRPAAFPLPQMMTGTVPIFFTPFHLPPSREAEALCRAMQTL